MLQQEEVKEPQPDNKGGGGAEKEADGLQSASHL